MSREERPSISRFDGDDAPQGKAIVSWVARDPDRDAGTDMFKKRIEIERCKYRDKKDGKAQAHIKRKKIDRNIGPGTALDMLPRQLQRTVRVLLAYLKQVGG